MPGCPMEVLRESTIQGPAFLLAIPCNDPLWGWVESNCPSDIEQAEFFRFLCTVGMQFMKQSMTKLHTDAAGVLDFTGYSSGEFDS
jgi:hypothetical protein